MLKPWVQMPHNTKSAGVIFWFRNDLRLHDQSALRHAIELATQLQTWLLPVYVHDSSLNALTPWGFARAGLNRMAWQQSAVDDLAAQVKALGSQLFQFKGQPAEILISLSQALGQARVVCEDIAAPFEQAQIQALQQYGVQVQTLWQSSLMAIEDLPHPPAQLPDQFTAFRRLVERPRFKVPQQIACIQSLPELPALQTWHERGLVPFVPARNPAPAANDARALFMQGQTPCLGGEREALKHLQNYVDRSLPSTYKITRNGLQGMDYSTKWSPWLATGALSARTAWHAIQSYEAVQGANDSTYWIGFELLWRDHFRWLHLKHGAKLYGSSGLRPPQTHSEHDEKKFSAWCTAQTGQRFIDAGMRELITTGYTSNRMRQNLASYLIHDLGCDWRAGAAWFESQLIDYDVYSNQGNWLYLSGQGTDPRGSRRFNPEKQAKDYDAEGRYQSLWSALTAGE